MSAPSRRKAESSRAAARMRGADRKRQLLSHAKQLFITLGYQNTTTDKIARAAGITEPVLYRHFKTKKALFLEVLQQIREATLTRWKSETAELPDPLLKLHRIADLYLNTTREHGLEMRIMHRTLIESDDPDIASVLRSFYVDNETFLAEIIAAGQQSGVFRRSLDPRVGAWELIRTALGYTLIVPLDIPLFQEADYLPRAIECMLACLLKTDV